MMYDYVCILLSYVSLLSFSAKMIIVFYCLSNEAKQEITGIQCHSFVVRSPSQGITHIRITWHDT